MFQRMGSNELEPPRQPRDMIDRSVRTTLLVTGMRDNTCRERVAAALEAVAGVREVDVNLFRARATVVHTAACGPADLIRALVAAGYGASPAAAA